MFNSQITSPQQAAEELALNRGAHDLRLLGAGVEFLFFSTRAGTRREGYRVPRARVFDTVNNPGIQALELQRKELRLSAWALGHGVPSANPTELVDQGGYSVLVTEVIDDDQTPVNQQALGAVLAKMHQVEPLASEVARCPDIYDYLAQRIGDRHSRISTDHQLPALPKPTHLAKVLQRSMHRSASCIWIFAGRTFVWLPLNRGHYLIGATHSLLLQNSRWRVFANTLRYQKTLWTTWTSLPATVLMAEPSMSPRPLGRCCVWMLLSCWPVLSPR